MEQVDSSEEEPPPLAVVTEAPYAARASRPTSSDIATQTPGNLMDHLLEFAERSSLTVVKKNPIRDQFWEHILSCIKMPRGGVAGGGSMHCSFEFVAANEAM